MREADPETIAMVARCQEHGEPSQLVADLGPEGFVCVSVGRPEPPYVPMGHESLAPSDRGIDGHYDKLPPVIP